MPERATAILSAGEVSRGHNSSRRDDVDEGPNVRKSKSTMNLKSSLPQKFTQVERRRQSKGEAQMLSRREEESSANLGDECSGEGVVMAKMLLRQNLINAMKRVVGNKGKPGVDGMHVEELRDWLKTDDNWSQLRAELVEGRYVPKPVRRVEIPKAGGGVRMLGIPTVVDRFIQQALLQVLQPEIDKTFSSSSYGFRPGKSAHQAVRRARSYVEEGHRVVVDVDLSRFFDRVNHDILMSRVAKHCVDKSVLRLIRRFLQAGMFSNGVVTRKHEGTPQGGPLSPLLANILLDDVDKELERRGHKFVRYADDCNVYVRSQRAGERVMAGLRKMYKRLHLLVNEEKSAVISAFQCQFLGFSFWRNAQGTRIRIAPKAIKKMKDRVRALVRGTGRSLVQIAKLLRSYLLGWKNYFRLAETPGVFRRLDEWIRHRLRMVQLRQWKRGKTVFQKLRALGATEGVSARAAANARRWWRNSRMLLNGVLPILFFDKLGVPRLASASI